MKRLFLTVIICLMACPISGCFNSESEYDRLVKEKNELAQQLALAQEENLILSQALASVTAEQERLQEVLNTERRRLAANALPLPEGMATATTVGEDIWVEPSTSATARQEAAPVTTQSATTPPATTQAVTPPATSQASARLTPPAASAESPSSRVHVVQSGDVLYNIAAKYNTTVEKILELNPRIRNRPNNMLQLKEKINLP